MRKHLLSALLATALLATATPSLADSYVKVTTQAGKVTLFTLSEQPTITFSTDSVLVSTVSLKLSYPASEQLTFELTDQTAAVNLAHTTGTVQFHMGDNLDVTGLEPSAPVVLYDAQGRKLASARATQQGSAHVSLSGLHGVIIVKTPQKTFKMIKQ